MDVQLWSFLLLLRPSKAFSFVLALGGVEAAGSDSRVASKLSVFFFINRTQALNELRVDIAV